MADGQVNPQVPKVWKETIGGIKMIWATPIYCPINPSWAVQMKITSMLVILFFTIHGKAMECCASKNLFSIGKVVSLENGILVKHAVNHSISLLISRMVVLFLVFNSKKHWSWDFGPSYRYSLDCRKGHMKKNVCVWVCVRVQRLKVKKTFFRNFPFSRSRIQKWVFLKSGNSFLLKFHIPGSKKVFWGQKIFFSIFVFWAHESKKLVCTSDIGAGSGEWRSRATLTTDCEAHPMLDCKISLEDIIKIFSAKRPHDDILYMNNVWLESLVKNYSVKKPCANHQMSAACVYVC